MCIYVPFTMINMYVCVILPDGLVNDPASRQIFQVHSMLRIGMHMSNDIIIYRCPWWIWYLVPDPSIPDTPATWFFSEKHSLSFPIQIFIGCIFSRSVQSQIGN